MLFVVLSPYVEKMHHDSPNFLLCIHPPGLNDEAMRYTPISVISTLSPCVYGDFAGSISLLHFLLMFSVVLLTDIATTHHASSKISRRNPLLYLTAVPTGGDANLIFSTCSWYAVPTGGDANLIFSACSWYAVPTGGDDNLTLTNVLKPHRYRASLKSIATEQIVDLNQY